MEVYSLTEKSNQEVFMIKMSEKIDQIAVALNKLQSLNLVVEKTEENPHYKSKFANLEGHWHSLRKPMTELGLSVMQLPSNVNGLPSLTTIIMHTSGQFIESTAVMSVVGNDPQKQVAAITYMRRASLSGAMGTVAIEDDDGNHASGKITQLPNNPSNYVITFGRYKGKTIGELSRADIESFYNWLKSSAMDKPLTGGAKEFVIMTEKYLNAKTNSPPEWTDEFST
jgi:hypothetical protein